MAPKFYQKVLRFVFFQNLPLLLLLNFLYHEVFSAAFSKMDDKNKLLEFVRQQILKSHPRHRIFEFLYPEFFESAELSSRISVFKWLHYVEKNEEEKVPQEYLLALQIICREFPKAKKAFKPQICPAGYSCQLNILSDRYALDSQYLSAKEFKLFLYDNFYGKRRFV